MQSISAETARLTLPGEFRASNPAKICARTSSARVNRDITEADAAWWLAVRIATRLMALLRRARLRRRSGYIRWNFSQANRVNALAAAWCAEHDPLPPPARLGPTSPS